MNTTNATALYMADQRMLELIDLLKKSGRIRFRQQFLDVIGMPKQHFRRIQTGEQHFTVEQISCACEGYNINANWIFGLEDVMFRGKKRVINLAGTEKPANGRRSQPG